MNLPFTSEQFLDVFQNYNTSIFPLQIIFNLLALFLVYLAVKRKTFSDKVISYSLSFFWLWIGIVYHYIFFSPVNPAARIFAVLFVLQGILFFYFAGIKEKINFVFDTSPVKIWGELLLIYALILYPVIGNIAGHAYPRNPTFGLPCPTTIFTFGMLLWSDKKVPWYLYVIPALWSFIGFTAAIKLGIYEDTGLLVAGVSAVIIFLFRKKEPELKKA